MHNDFILSTRHGALCNCFSFVHYHGFIGTQQKSNKKNLLKLCVDDEDNDDELDEKTMLLLPSLSSSSSFIRTLMLTNTNTIAKTQWKYPIGNKSTLYTEHTIATNSHRHYLCEHIIIHPLYIRKLIENVHMRNEISQKCNICHVIDFYNVELQMHITNTMTMTETNKKQGWKFQIDVNPSAAIAFDRNTNTAVKYARTHCYTVFHLHPDNSMAVGLTYARETH